MNLLLPNLVMPIQFVSMLDQLIKEKEDGKYVITFSNEKYSKKDGGVQPHLIAVEKENGHYRLLSLSAFGFYGDEYMQVTHFDFVKKCGFTDRAFSFNFDEDPFISEALESNTVGLAQKYESNCFDLPVVRQLN
ncbi:DUF2787 family protein [Moritella sp. F3]|uniref:DUF2787 family protein n=1 Tax=Moritella sp. F3 TaxID=2718882 RepID=UPI0018E1A581|nr:DUF2787 family protein [Moritella sp. F3]GIC77101.1 hypothetical protein FMO001_18280 [Moritella sp. F1]GIC82220.1 hypothetical protein FMO003_25010 [Moritella sp. F3]